MNEGDGVEGAGSLRGLLGKVEWLEDSLAGSHLPHVFIRPLVGDGGEDGVSASSCSHFSGAVTILRESVKDEPPLLPHLRREGVHGDVRVSSITFIAPRDAVVGSWPDTARFIPKEHALAVVTLEDADIPHDPLQEGNGVCLERREDA